MSEMLELAKRIAERAGKNAKVAPELLYAPILWELQDDARSSAVSVEPVAWRWRYTSETLWRYRSGRPSFPTDGAGVQCEPLYDRPAPGTAPQSARTESHSPAAMEGEKDTIVNLIHEHVGFEVLLAIESGVLTGVEKAAEAILAELGRRSQAVNAPSLNVKSICESTKDRRCIEVWLAEPVTAADRDALTAAMTRPQCGGK